MRKCCVLGCDGKSSLRRFSFPKDGRMREIWMKRAYVPVYSDKLKICGIHFHATSFSKVSSKRIKHFVVPTLNLPEPCEEENCFFFPTPYQRPSNVSDNVKESFVRESDMQLAGYLETSLKETDDLEVKQPIRTYSLRQRFDIPDNGKESFVRESDMQLAGFLEPNIDETDDLEVIQPIRTYCTRRRSHIPDRKIRLKDHHSTEVGNFEQVTIKTEVFDESNHEVLNLNENNIISKIKTEKLEEDISENKDIITNTSIKVENELLPIDVNIKKEFELNDLICGEELYHSISHEPIFKTEKTSVI